ncbi:chemotaxis protein CheW [Candidatus Nitrospira nitrificans]|uniref:Putative CheW-like signal transduction protein n=1 Tax=Candidatus Nitrospira nitrificans TaxID=1742973 RepID=A0A0S4LSY0_9BACT|nr:chemotaxis protein CheW [Candidatus Nitrospira nitrificans]CUS39014.1 putative CheW-like signal transduction protein [Candidatus Nitrospira nitrificans]
MLRTAQTHQRETKCRSCQLLVFSVGGRRLAVRSLDVSSIVQWAEPIPVAAQTPFITSVIRQEQTVLPVFDLAVSLHLTVQGNSPLWLRVKHPFGEMAICIDDEIPVLHALDSATIQPYHGKDLPADGSYTTGLDEIPILSVSQLGLSG